MKQRILIVDDYIENLILLEEIFDVSGLDTIKAESGAAAIEIAIKEIPDLILLDIMMPEIDGFTVSKTLKENELTKEIPIIFLTALTDANSILKSFAFGGVDYIGKPFNEAELLARVYTHLEIQKQRKIIEQQLIQLQQREKDLKTIFEQSNDAFIITSKTGEIRNVNKKACEILEYTIDEIKALSIKSIISVKASKNNNFLDEIASKKNLIFETENISKSGKIIPVEISSSIINFLDEDVILLTCRNLTERKKSEKALKKSEEKFRSFFENNTATMLQIDNNTKKILNFNKSAENFYGFSKEEFLEKTIYEIEQQPSVEINEIIQTAISKGSNLCRFKHKTASGEIKCVELSASSVETSEGLSMFLIINDISKLAKAEEKIKKLSTAVEQSANSIIITDTSGKIEYVNPKFSELTGYASQEVIGQHTSILESNKEPKKFYQNLWETIEKGKTWRGEFHNKAKNGKLFWEWVTITPIKNKLGKTINFLAVKEDITERKKIEEELKIQYQELLVAKQIAEENEEKFRAVFDNSADSIAAAIKYPDKIGKFILANKQAIKTYGYNKEDFLKITPIDIQSKIGLSIFDDVIKQIEKHGAYRFETEHITKNKKTIPVEVNTKLIKIQNNDVYLSIIRDISERKQMEQKILSTIIETEEKERERIAQDLHDGLGPLMSTIKLYVQWLTKPGLKANKDVLAKKAEETIEIAYISLRSIANNLSPHILRNFGLISAVKSFSDRVKELKLIEFNIKTNLNQRINHIIETVAYRIITESINNSLKHANAKKIDISIFEENMELKIKYSDNGIGFDVDKVIQKKAGLGLFNIINRVKSIGGKIEITSEKGLGTEILVNIKL